MSAHPIVMEELPLDLLDQAEAHWILATRTYASALHKGYAEILDDPKMASRWMKVLDAIDAATKAVYPEVHAGYLRRKSVEASRLAVDGLRERLKSEYPTNPGQAAGHP